jgi:uncharacterized GH25 family protein
MKWGILSFIMLCIFNINLQTQSRFTGKAVHDQGKPQQGATVKLTSENTTVSSQKDVFLPSPTKIPQAYSP